jgi:hypothetical protein
MVLKVTFSLNRIEDDKIKKTLKYNEQNKNAPPSPLLARGATPPAKTASK